MTKEQVRKAVYLQLGWLGFLCMVLVMAPANLLPFRLAFVTPSNLFLCFIEAQLFFVLIIWPLFLMDRKAGWTPFLHLALLFLLALPLGVACAGVSHAGPGEFLRGTCMVAAPALFLAALFHLANRFKANIAPWYFLAVFAISVIPPFAEFLLLEHPGAGGKVPAIEQAGYPFLRNASPFMAAGDGAASVLYASLLGALAVALGGLGMVFRRQPAAADSGASAEVNP